MSSSCFVILLTLDFFLILLHSLKLLSLVDFQLDQVPLKEFSRKFTKSNKIEFFIELTMLFVALLMIGLKILLLGPIICLVVFDSYQMYIGKLSMEMYWTMKQIPKMKKQGVAKLIIIVFIFIFCIVSLTKK